MLSLSSDEMIKHWLLNTAVEAGVPLTHFFPGWRQQTLNVRPIPGCRSEDYARGLIGLFKSGMITFSSGVTGDDVESEHGVAQILDRFLRLSIDDSTLQRDGDLLKSYQRYRLPGMQVSFELTALGGEAWEKIAEPDWARYVSVSTILPTSGDLRDGDLVSADRDLLIAYMGWYPEVNSEQIRLETVKWQTHTDFEILYWKRLPFVYHASFEVQPAEARWVDGQPKWFLDWWDSICSWHKHPWNLPGWPSE